VQGKVLRLVCFCAHEYKVFRLVCLCAHEYKIADFTPSYLKPWLICHSLHFLRGDTQSWNIFIEYICLHIMGLYIHHNSNFWDFGSTCPDKGSLDHEPWSFGEECEEVCRLALLRRYRLLPHIYTLFYLSHTNGTPVAAPVYFAGNNSIMFL
jgi:hypothetical protein